MAIRGGLILLEKIKTKYYASLSVCEIKQNKPVTVYTTITT